MPNQIANFANQYASRSRRDKVVRTLQGPVLCQQRFAAEYKGRDGGTRLPHPMGWLKGVQVFVGRFGRFAGS